MAAGKPILKPTMKITENTLHTITATFSAMLTPAELFCVGPVVVIATRDRMRAGMEQARQMRPEPQKSSVTMEKVTAHSAIPSLFFAGGGTLVTVAAG